MHLSIVAHVPMDLDCDRDAPCMQVMHAGHACMHMIMQILRLIGIVRCTLHAAAAVQGQIFNYN